MKRKIDKISELPDHIIEDILSRLSTRDAVRTSLLSRKWRRKWTTTPSIAFSFPRVQFQYTVEEELAPIVDHVLWQHVGPIHNFNLHYLDKSPPDHDMDRWIRHLSRSRHIKELSLTFDTRCELYTLPSRVFSFQNLTRLKLSHCSLRPDPTATFKGFGNLRILDLTEVTSAPDVLQLLICGSPMLEWADLWVEYMVDFIQNNTKVEHLRLLKYLGKGTDRLVVVNISRTFVKWSDWLGESYVVKLSDHELFVRRLQLG